MAVASTKIRCLSGSMLTRVYPPEIKHGWLENGPFTDDIPMKTPIHGGFSIAMFDYQRVVPPFGMN